jgi:KaiC/GvpD/RAD55 family RecA-like ATPase
MTNEILSGKYQRIVLDSITPLSEMPIYINNLNNDNISNNNLSNSDETSNKNILPVKRLHLHFIMNSLETSESTSVVTSELQMGSSLFSRDGISEFLVDGVITLSFDPTMDRRKLSIMKMRNTKHTLKPKDIEISKGGIKII